MNGDGKTGGFTPDLERQFQYGTFQGVANYYPPLPNHRWFIIGFFLGGIPWYFGTFILVCVRVDHREKPGYVACAIASILAMIAVTLGATRGSHPW